MTYSKRGSRFGWLALFLGIVFLGTALCGSGYGETLRFVFIADSRSPEECRTINTKVLDDLNEQILKWKPEFVIYGGDIASYGINGDGSNNFLPFKDLMRKLTDKGIKLYVALGNHELYKYEETNEKKYDHTFFYLAGQQQYQQVFADMPDNGPPGYERLVYSFESPGHDAFFAILDPFYLDESMGGFKQDGNLMKIDDKQLEWLRKEIQKTKATHKFLCMHTPIYPVLDVDKDKSPTSSTKLWEILDKAHFDIFLCGHEHLYSRQAINSKVNSNWRNSVVQLINGGAGAPAYKKDLNPERSDWHIDNWDINQKKWGDDERFYYTVVDINGKQVKVITYGGNNGKYSPIDKFSIPENSKTEIIEK